MTATNMTDLYISGLYYRRHNKTLLNDINIFSKGENCAAVMGANGAGKSLLLKLCHGIISPSSGAIRWGGASPSQCRARTAMVFQHPEFLRRSVRANINFVLRARGASAKIREGLIAKVLAAVGLESRAKQLAAELSGGERQRLAIARAYALEPGIMLLDEPTSGQDVSSIKKVEKIIGDLKSKGVKMLIATHNFALARKFCEEVLFLRNGSVAFQGGFPDFSNKFKGDELCDILFLR